MNYPLHKPKQLDGIRPGAREALYGPGRWTGERYEGWESVEAAEARTRNRSTDILYRMGIVRNHFDIEDVHIRGINPKNTRKAIDRVRRLIGYNTQDLAEHAKLLAELGGFEKKL